MSNSVIYFKLLNEKLNIKICAIPDWDGFDKLIMFFKKFYNAKIIQAADGPDARRWILESNGKIFELIHDDMSGNYIVAPSEDSEELVYAIGKNLENRLKDIDKSTGDQAWILLF